MIQSRLLNRPSPNTLPSTIPFGFISGWAILLRFRSKKSSMIEAKTNTVFWMCLNQTVQNTVSISVRFPLPPNPAQNRRFFLFCFSSCTLWHIFTRIFFEKKRGRNGPKTSLSGKKGEEMGKFFEVVNQPSDSEIITAIVSLNRPTKYYIT